MHVIRVLWVCCPVGISTIPNCSHCSKNRSVQQHTIAFWDMSSDHVLQHWISLSLWVLNILLESARNWWRRSFRDISVSTGFWSRSNKLQFLSSPYLGSILAAVVRNKGASLNSLARLIFFAQLLPSHNNAIETLFSLPILPKWLRSFSEKPVNHWTNFLDTLFRTYTNHEIWRFLCMVIRGYPNTSLIGLRCKALRYYLDFSCWRPHLLHRVLLTNTWVVPRIDWAARASTRNLGVATSRST